MGLQGDYGRLLAGLPIPVSQANIAVRQPSVKEIIAFGEDDFLVDVGMFTNVDALVGPIKKSGDSRLQTLSDFQILMSIIENDTSVRRSVEGLFDLILSDYKYKMDAGGFLFSTEESAGRFIGRLRPSDMDEFAKVLKELFIPYGTQEEEYNPVNDRAAEIAEKLRRGRRKLNELKQKNDDGANSLFATDISILSVGLQMDVNVLMNYTPFQLYDAFTRYTRKQVYDFYQKVATTPFMDVSNVDAPDNWLDSLYK